jgi:hypothetical protein
MPPNAPRGRGGAVRAPNARWTNTEIDSLVSQLKDAKDAGNSSENGFKASVWASIASSFSDLMKKTNRVCESKWSRLKKDYKDVKFLRECSGFGWDEVKCIVTAEPEI